MLKKNIKMNYEARLILEMKRYFGGDKRRIRHAEDVLSFSKQILKEDPGDRKVVIASAVLHDVGIKNCELKYGACTGQLQEKEGPPVARKILQGLEYNEKIISEVCLIIGSHHSPGEVNSVNFDILWDADCLVNLRDQPGVLNGKKTKMIINKTFCTAVGRKLAEKIICNKEKKCRKIIRKKKGVLLKG